MDIRPFINLLKRTIHSRYGKLLMNNRMLIGCYDLLDDTDVGSHYILMIPDTEEYTDPFYELSLIMDVRQITDAYRSYHTVFDEERRNKKIKPKDAKEEANYEIIGDKCNITVDFILGDNIYSSYAFSIPVATDDMQFVSNITNTYDKLIERVKVGGECVLLDLNRIGIIDKIIESPDIYWQSIHIGNKWIDFPFTRSMFSGIKEFDAIYLSIQESTMQYYYVYTLTYEKRGIQECYFGYLLRF